jgi:hypothetical protein
LEHPEEVLGVTSVSNDQIGELLPRVAGHPSGTPKPQSLSEANCAVSVNWWYHYDRALSCAAGPQAQCRIVFALGSLFYWSFMFAKHDPALRDVIPFGDDPV